ACEPCRTPPRPRATPPARLRLPGRSHREMKLRRRRRVPRALRSRCPTGARSRPGRGPLGARLARAPEEPRYARRDLTYPGWRVTHFIEDYGLVFLFGIVCLESAGLWLPGETALIAAAVYASNGHLTITGVITVAAVAAIIGDNIGYWLGREGGRRLFYRYALLSRVA